MHRGLLLFLSSLAFTPVHAALSSSDWIKIVQELPPRPPEETTTFCRDMTAEARALMTKIDRMELSEFIDWVHQSTYLRRMWLEAMKSRERLTGNSSGSDANLPESLRFEAILGEMYAKARKGGQARSRMEADIGKLYSNCVKHVYPALTGWAYYRSLSAETQRMAREKWGFPSFTISILSHHANSINRGQTTFFRNK